MLMLGDLMDDNSCQIGAEFESDEIVKKAEKSRDSEISVISSSTESSSTEAWGRKKHQQTENKTGVEIQSSATSILRNTEETIQQCDITISDPEGSNDDIFIHEKSGSDCETLKKKSKGFICGVCGRVTSSAQRLKEHLSCHTGEKHLQCEICGKKFAWRYSYKSHMVCHSSNNPNKCNICGKKYCNKSAMKNHILRKHGAPSKDFKCDKCHKEFVTNSELKRHSFNHSKEKPHMCEYCGNSYRFKGALLVHYRIHSGEKPYHCNFCELSFIHKSSAVNHHRIHTGEKPFQCSICKKMFRVKRSLTSHMSVHNDNRPFKCKECEKTFRSRSGFRVHLDFHLGLKRHICKYCGKAFRAWNNMHKHIRKHTVNQTHKCKVCDKTFLDQKELKSHMKCHSVKRKKCVKNKLPHIDHDIGVPADPVHLSTDMSLHTCMNTNFSSHSTVVSHHSNTSQISSHSHIQQTDQPMLYPHETHDKNQTDRCHMISENYVPQFFPSSQHTDSQYVQHSLIIPNLYTVSHSNQMNYSRPPCVPDVPHSDFSNVNTDDYVNYFGLQPTSEQLTKCKLCRNVFQSILDLKQHLMEYHRIEEESIDELLK